MKQYGESNKYDRKKDAENKLKKDKDKDQLGPDIIKLG